MTLHDLKIDHHLFDDVLNNHKKAEIRKNDRDYQVGDVLTLKQTKPGDRTQYTGKAIVRLVTHVLKDYPHLAHDYVMLSIRPLSKFEKLELFK